MSSCGEMGEAIELRWVKRRGRWCGKCVAVGVWLLGSWQVMSKQATFCASVHTFIGFLRVIEHLGAFLLGNWVDCYRSNQHLGLFFLSLTSFFCPSSWPCFTKADICRLYRGQREIWGFHDSCGLLLLLLLLLLWLLLLSGYWLRGEIQSLPNW